MFFPFFPVSFLLHLCCMQFFSSDNRLQKIFFQNQPPPPPPRVKWSAPKIQKTANSDDLFGNTQAKLSFQDWCISILSSKKCQTPIILADLLGNESLLQQVNFWDRESAIKCRVLAELSFPQACYFNLYILAQDVRMADIRLAWLVYLSCFRWHVLRAYCTFTSKQPVSITLFGARPNNKIFLIQNDDDDDDDDDYEWPMS